jgi:hypothetical protein
MVLESDGGQAREHPVFYVALVPGPRRIYRVSQCKTENQTKSVVDAEHRFPCFVAMAGTLRLMRFIPSSTENKRSSIRGVGQDTPAVNRSCQHDDLI